MFFNSKASNFYKPETAQYFDPKKDSKVAVITGGNQGIGFFTVLHLYLHGFKVYVLGRNEEKCSQAIEDIKKEATKRQAEYSEEEKATRFFGSLHYIKCDLLKLKNVEEAANEVIKSEPKLDLLINNAGLLGAPYEITEDGFEIQLQVNMVSHMLLTLKLVPLLNKSPEPRVVCLSSVGHYISVRYHKDSKQIKGFPGPAYALARYGAAKLAVIHFAKVLAETHPNIQCSAVHPGVIDTQLYDPLFSTFSFLKPIMKKGFSASSTFISVTNEVGSYASLRAALGPKPDQNGFYFSTGGVAGAPSKLARNKELAQITWDTNISALKDLGFEFDE